MQSLQVVREDLPDDIQKEIKRLFEGEAYHNCSLYGTKKYFLTDLHHKILFTLLPQIKLRPDDVWIGGYMRSGTHWLAEISWLINNNLDFDTARNVYIYDRVKIFIKPDYKNFFKPTTLETYEDIPSRRFFKHHLPLSLLPPNTLDTSKVVYVARDPRDAFLSLYHILGRWDHSKFRGSIEEAAELFCKGYWINTPYFANVLEYWELRHHKNMLFLFYEDMVKDLPSVVRRIAKFFDKDFTESQYEQLCEYLQFDNMKEKKSFHNDYIYSKDIQLIWKGKIGGWREEFTEDMKKRFETRMADNLKGTDLPFLSFS